MHISKLVMLALLATSAAKAAPITYVFTGTVTQVGTNTYIPIAVGQQIPIAITVEGAYPQSSNAGSYFSASSSLVLSATFAGEQDNGLIQNIMVNPGSSFQINTASPQVSAGFGLTLASPQAGALPTSAIPLSLDPGTFGVGTFSVVEAFSASQFGFSGTINGLASSSSTVPEPASLALLGAGLLGVVTRRRRI